jgi:hypothetical protein
MEQTECSETLEFKLQTLVNNPEDIVRHSKHGKSLKPAHLCLTTFSKLVQQWWPHQQLDCHWLAGCLMPGKVYDFNKWKFSLTHT